MNLSGQYPDRIDTGWILPEIASRWQIPATTGLRKRWKPIAVRFQPHGTQKPARSTSMPSFYLGFLAQRRNKARAGNVNLSRHRNRCDSGTSTGKRQLQQPMIEISILRGKTRSSASRRQIIERPFRAAGWTESSYLGRWLQILMVLYVLEFRPYPNEPGGTSLLEPDSPPPASFYLLINGNLQTIQTANPLVFVRSFYDATRIRIFSNSSPKLPGYGFYSLLRGIHH